MKVLLAIIAFAVLLASPLMAQPADPNKPDDQLTKDEAEIRINEFTATTNGLKSQLDAATARVNELNAQLNQTLADTKKCNDDIYAMVGATDADVSAFREKLGRIENRVRELGAMSDDQLNAAKSELDGLENDLNALRGQKMAVLPEFYNKIIDVGAQIKGLRDRINNMTKSYTVGTWQQDRDCLWNIAGKAQAYSDPFMWPKIWQANTDKIRNPDVIYPGQVLTIPASTGKNDDELRAERLYYRKKKMGRRVYSRETQYNQQDAGSGGR